MEVMRTPALRFRGFTDAWKNRKLGELYTERDERGEDSLKILSVSIHHGVSSEELDSESLGKKVRRSEDKSLYKHVYPGDFVLNMMRAWQGAIGVVKSEGMISPAYIAAVSSDQLYPLFMDFCLGREESIRQMNNLSYGVTDFRKRLYWDSFIRVMCHIPSVPEQEMITAFLIHLDQQIDLHQRKYVKLQNLKSAMLEKMFPKDGTDVPEIRFHGFSGAWARRKLSEITYPSGIKNNNNDSYESYSISNEYGFIPQEEQFERGGTMRDADKSMYYIVSPQSFAYNPARINVGSIGYQNMERSVIVSSLYEVFKTTVECNDDFLWYWIKTAQFQKMIEKRQEGGVRLYFYYDKFCMGYMSLPKIEEQTKIGSFFNNLDNHITHHKLENYKLESIKKSMLKRMFV